MAIAYILFGHDNGSHAYRWAGAARCPACGYVTDRSKIDPSLRIRRRNLHVSFTYDHLPVVSRQFADACHSTRAVDFVRLEGSVEFLALFPRRVVAFDVKVRGTQFEDLCATCNRYESIAGATPATLVMDRLPANEGLFRTDLEFGSGDEKAPLVLVAPSTKAALEREFRGLEWEAVEGRPS